MFLFHFGTKRKTLSQLFVPSVMFHYKPKIKDFWHLICKKENPCLVTQRSKKWKADSNCWWQVWKLGAYIIYNDCIIWYEFNLALYVILQNFSKISYLIPEAVGPSFNTLNIEDVKQSSSVFIIHYDEKFIILSRRWWNTIITIAIPWKWWSKCW